MFRPEWNDSDEFVSDKIKATTERDGGRSDKHKPARSLFVFFSRHRKCLMNELETCFRGAAHSCCCKRSEQMSDSTSLWLSFVPFCPPHLPPSHTVVQPDQTVPSGVGSRSVSSEGQRGPVSAETSAGRGESPQA